jgi:hypothetical protein
MVYSALPTLESVYPASVAIAFTVCVVETVIGVVYVLVVPPEQRFALSAGVVPSVV